jgi:hypothetical protein
MLFEFFELIMWFNNSFIMKTLFSRSCSIVEELATRERRTSSTQANNFRKFIDRSLIILDRHAEAFFSSDSKFEELQDFILVRDNNSTPNERVRFGTVNWIN